MTAEIVSRVERDRLARQRQLADLVQQIAHDLPGIDELPPEQLSRLASRVAEREYEQQMQRAVNLERVDYPASRARFITSKKSARTRDLYSRAITGLEVWCLSKSVHPLQLGPADVDDWIRSLKGAPATVRLQIAAVNAFFNRLVRWHSKEITSNPFRGTDARPKAKPARALVVPSEDEIAELRDYAPDPVLYAAIVVMHECGVRIGALPSLSVSGTTWRALTKGKEQSGPISKSTRDALLRSKLTLRQPFAGLTETKIRDRFMYHAEKLHKREQIRAVYSPHDLRHAFAVRLYMKTRDIYAVSRALGHASVSVTQTYLRSLPPLEGLLSR